MASAPMGTSMSHMTCSAGSCGQVREDICMIGRVHLEGTR